MLSNIDIIFILGEFPVPRSMKTEERKRIQLRLGFNFYRDDLKKYCILIDNVKREKKT